MKSLVSVQLVKVKATDDVTTLKLNPTISSRPKDRLSSGLISKPTTVGIRKLTLLIAQILQSDIFIGRAGKDLILFSVHARELEMMLNVGY